MPLACDILIDPELSFSSRPELVRLIEWAANRLPGIPSGDWSITLRLTDDVEIARLHLEYFHDPTVTDVITFPSGDDFAAAEGHLGDIAVSIDTAELQATEVGHSAEREIAFLGLHGLLHLLGYTDTTTTDRTSMLAVQTRLLEAFEVDTSTTW
jgi:probable rRNA maturation factor